MNPYSYALAITLLMGSGQAIGKQSWLDARPVPVDGAGQRFCDALAEVPLPAADQPTAAEAKALGSGCDSIALYEGIGRPPDYRKARLCAYVERESGDKDTPEPFAGDGVLLMIYANGRGVRRNVPIAKQLACRIWSAPAELDSRQQHLDAIASGEAPADLDICDDVTSGMMEGLCAGQAARVTDFERGRRLDKLSAGWSGDAKKAFGRLRQAEAAFSDSSSGNEEDMSGTARNAMAEARAEKLDEEFEKSVVDFAAGKFAASAGDAQADAKLNATYRRMLAAFAGSEDKLMTIRPDGLRETQRLWLRYRDAWLEFARVLKPGADTSPLLRALTTQRTKQLEDVTEYASY